MVSEFEAHEMEPSSSEDDLGIGQNVEIVHLRLRDMILRGELPVAVPLSQVKLAQQLGVSRTPLREALRLLQHEGLVRGEPRQRVRISGFSIMDLEQLYAARITLEALGIRLTIPNLSADDLKMLEGHLIGIEQYSMLEDYDQWRVPHRAFHRGLVAHAGERIVSLIAQLSDHAERYRRVYTLDTPGAWTAGVKEHRAIFDACVAGDLAAASDRLGRHYAHVALSVIALAAPEHDPAIVRAALRMVMQTESERKRGIA
jgi:DNA-binding GntR family transcriptional regulator